MVAGVQTGNDTSAASVRLPETATTWNRAVPGRAADAGKRTSTRSLAGTRTRRPSPSVSIAFVARTATSTVIASSVWFCTTTGNSNRSPKLRKRGADGRAINGSRAVIADSPLPARAAPSTAATNTR